MFTNDYGHTYETPTVPLSNQLIYKQKRTMSPGRAKLNHCLARRQQNKLIIMQKRDKL